MSSGCVVNNISPIHFKGGHAAAQLVEALRYKPEGRGFDSFLTIRILIPYSNVNFRFF
jgi:hypothetical protein